MPLIAIPVHLWEMSGTLLVLVQSWEYIDKHGLGLWRLLLIHKQQPPQTGAKLPPVAPIGGMAPIGMGWRQSVWGGAKPPNWRLTAQLAPIPRIGANPPNGARARVRSFLSMENFLFIVRARSIF